MVDTVGVRDACREYVTGAVLPILYVEGSVETSDLRGHVLGTGFLIQDDEDVYLVTAGHVLEIEPGMEPHRISIPVHGENTDVYSLSPDQFIAGKATNADFAVVRLTYDAHVMQRIHWNTFTLDSFRTDNRLDPDEEAFVYGFPEECQELREGDPNVYLKSVGFVTRPYQGNLSSVEKYDPVIDVLFSYKDTLTIRGEVLPTPGLRGISGCPIFCIDSQVEGFWTAQKALRIIGVQKAVLRNKYIRASRATVVEKSLRSLISQIRSSEP